MNERQKLTQLTSEEIDRLLGDSSLSLPSADDPAVARTPWIAPKSTFNEEDLALLDDTGMFEQSSSVATEKGHNENAIQGTTQILSWQAERTSAATDEIPPVRFEADPTVSAPPTDPFSLPACGSSPVSMRENHDHPRSLTQKRSSLSKLVHGWTTLMGHPIAGSISSQLSASPQSVSIFSPLLTQSSKLLTGVVSSFLSPWAAASRQIAEASEHGFVQDRPCEDSLINAFEKPMMLELYGIMRSFTSTVFFSPNRDRDETKSARNASISPLPTVRLRSAMMEDTQCGPNAESSVYSDAISSQPSPARSAPETTRRSMPLSSQRPSTHLFGDPGVVSSSHLELQSEVESFPPRESGCCASRLVNVDSTPSVSLSKTIAEEDTSKITRNLHLGLDVSPKREVFHRNILSAESEISEDTVAFLTHSHETSKNFTVDVFSRKLEGTTSTNSADVYREGLEHPATNLTPRPTSKSRVPCSPFPMMISMLNDDEEWNRTRKSAHHSSVPISSRRKSKSVVDRRKAESKDDVPRPSAELCQESSKRCEMAVFEQLSPHLNSDICSPTFGSVNVESATSHSHCSIPSCSSAELLSATCGMSQPPLCEAANSIAFTDSEQEDKENVSPHASATVTRRRATHLIPVLSVTTAPVPAPRHSAHKAKTKLSLPTDKREIAKVKAQLHREIKTLKAKEATLRLVLSKYETAFEEALDQRSQVYFATASARAQAGNEVSETRRQAATLYNAVLDSQRRHERMREAIEKAEANQKEWLKRVEALRTKHAHQSEKGVTYQKYCLGKIQRALENQEATTTEMEKELSKLRVHSKQMEMKQRSLEAELRQKAQENQELTCICDSLLT
ncbi:Transforming acidic coiled-coil-containing protein 3 [Taenia solium]|eukprot:TsM_000961600 transcript=TsM_000961600 gene=TsM_000961600